MNHLHLSRNPRCTSARDRLQPTYSGTLEQEPSHPSLATDVEMVDLSDIEPTTPLEQSNQIGITADIDMSDYEDDGFGPQSIFEEVPNAVTCPLNAQASVILNSDTEESDDDDGNQDQLLHSVSETPPGPTRSTTDQTGKFIHTAWVLVLNETH